MTVRPFPLILALLALAGIAGGCGGGDAFSGDPELPDGYKTYSADGISFAHPGDWQVEARTDADGAPVVEITPPDKDQTPYGLIRLSVATGAGDRFESLADQRRLVIKDVNDAKIESDEAVEIPNADEALRASTTTPAERGTDPVEVKAESLDVLRGDDVIVLTAASPQREGGSFDAAAVVESFRLDG